MGKIIWCTKAGHLIDYCGFKGRWLEEYSTPYQWWISHRSQDCYKCRDFAHGAVGLFTDRYTKNRSGNNKGFAYLPRSRHFSYLSFVFLVACLWTGFTSGFVTWAFRDSLVSVSYISVCVLAFQVFATMPGFIWVLWILTWILGVAGQSCGPLSTSCDPGGWLVFSHYTCLTFPWFNPISQ